ncbi:homeobox protein siamois-like [Hyla sarda]|uniref:homeobox protein siamois-like n=1 Tax=Hyla sarda TaxID=327740 RepID=UPI0024C29465|nr:homeobox protein siamois-like [Hyla sarda]
MGERIKDGGASPILQNHQKVILPFVCQYAWALAIKVSAKILNSFLQEQWKSQVMDTELDQVLYTILSLEEDYPALSPPLRSQEHLTSNLFTFSEFISQKETQEKLHNSTILQQTVCELYSILGICDDSQTGKYMGQSIRDRTIPKTNNENQIKKPLKRKSSDDGQYGCKKPKIVIDNFQAVSSSARSRKKTVYSSEQIKFLQNQFDCNPYPDFVKRCRISQITGIPEPRIQVWFQNRRARYLPRSSQIPEKKKSTTQIPPCGREKLPFTSHEDIWLF